MKQELSAYLNRQAEIVNAQGELDFSLTAIPLAVEKIKSCKNVEDCLKYSLDNIGLTWNWFAETFLANYCCEECKLYERKPS